MSAHDQPEDIIALPGTIALFPLRRAVLLPKGHLPLNIFEPRYLAMIEHALGHGRMVGMIRPRHDDDDSITPSLYEIGCAGRVSNFAETNDGQFLVTLKGVQRFTLKSNTLSAQGFLLGAIDGAAFAADRAANEEDTPTLRSLILEELQAYLAAIGLSADWESMEGASTEEILNSLAISCPFAPEEQQALLEAQNLIERAQTLRTLMEMAIASSGLQDDDDLPLRRPQ